MESWQAAILGVIQGLAEFLPVSSSTHLAMAKSLMKISREDIYFDLLCHLGTLLAATFYLRKEIIQALRSPYSTALFFVALLPLIPAYLLLRPLRLYLTNQNGYFLLITSAWLFFISKKRDVLPTIPSRKWRDVLWIGLAQSLSLIPGISRSGSTIGAARLLGWEWQEAARFSFVLAIPAVLGGNMLELLRYPRDIAWDVGLIGFFFSFLVGLTALHLFLGWLEKGNIRPFGWYCLIAGCCALKWL